MNSSISLQNQPDYKKNFFKFTSSFINTEGVVFAFKYKPFVIKQIPILSVNRYT